MKQIISSFILTTVAGLSTIIGYFAIFIKGNKKRIIGFGLSFSCSVMLTISIIDLIPSAYNYLSEYHFFFRFLLLAFSYVLGVILSYYISLIETKKTNNSLKKIGYISMIAIVLHNIPEGIITFMVSGVDFKLGLKLALAISFHNIPEGISISIPYFYATNQKLKTFLIVFLSGFSEILGAFICFLFFKNFVNDFLIGCSFSFIAGIMMNISTTELLPESIKYVNKKEWFLSFVLGVFLMIVTHKFLST